jgi:hypothetical protein
MKNLRFVCLALGIAVWVGCAATPARAQEESPFTLVERVAVPDRLYLHMFSTSVGKYTIRHDGFGEVYVGIRKENFHLKRGGRTKIEWMYVYEYNRDLLLLYRTGETGYLVRLDQRTRKIKSATFLDHHFEPPVIRDKAVVFSDGTSVPL